METVKLLVLAGIFFALTPGILVKIPSGGSVLKVAAAHAILFGLVYLAGTYFFESLEGFRAYDGFTPAGITAAAARNGYSLLYMPNVGLLPSIAFPQFTLPKCNAGSVIDITKARSLSGPFPCIPIPSQYVLPSVSGASLDKTPSGGGWLASVSPTSTGIFSISKLFTKQKVVFPYCPAGYAYDPSNRACVVAPTTAISYINGKGVNLPKSPYA
jgi:hypothetical protein